MALVVEPWLQELPWHLAFSQAANQYEVALLDSYTGMPHQSEASRDS